MAQSALTVTPANPTPPTNLSCVGNTPPLDPAQAQVDDGFAGWPGTVASPSGGVNGFISGIAFAAKTAAANTAGAPGANISNDSEGRGTETTVTATSVNPSPYGQFVSFSDLGNYTNLVSSGANGAHASSLSAAKTPTITGLVPASTASGAGTIGLTVNGTNFDRTTVITINGVPQTTQFVSATQVTVTNAPKKATSGTLPVTATTGGASGVTTAPTNWTFT
jgi:hypothetical protein